MKKRLDNIDILKGIAIILMSVVHINSLFFTNPFGVLDLITFLGATVCFTTFLFASGFLVVKKLKANNSDNWRKIFKKSLYIYIYFVIVGIISIAFLQKDLTISSTTNLLILTTLPLYAEFLISFVWFLIFSKLFSKIIVRLLKTPYLLILITIAIFFVGNILYGIEVSNPILIWIKTHMVGHESIHSFPLLQYMPVYILGVVLAKYGSKKTYLLTGGVTLLSLTILKIFNIGMWYRWPPSMSFLLYGILFVSIVLFLAEYIKSYKNLKIITLFGKYSLDSLLILTVLTIMSTLLFPFSSSSLYIFILNIGILITSYILVKILKKA